jgi:hypothetical protein
LQLLKNSKGQGDFVFASAKARTAPFRAFIALAVLAATLLLGVSLAGAVPPLTTVEDATDVQYTTAHVKGEVDRQGLATTYRFQYASQAEFEAEGFSNPHGGPEGTLEEGGPGPQGVEGDLSELAPATVYHLRLLAENEDGSSKSVAASTFETLAVSAPDATLEAPVVGPDSAELKGKVDLGGEDPAFNATARFEVSTDGGNTWAGFEGSEIGLEASSGEEQPVTATLTGLEPNTTYDLRLRATNNADPGLEDTDAGQSFSTAALAPTVETLGTLDTTEHSITFNGRIDPNKAQTTYWFDYGSAPGTYTASVPLAKDASAGASDGQVLVAQTVEGLDPATTLYYRLVADNGTGGEVAGEERQASTLEAAGPPAPCANEAVREEQHATHLPECRAWEQVSPADKNGVDVQNFLKAAIDGHAVAFQANGAFAGVADPNASVIYVSRREMDGRWSTRALNPRFTPTSSVSALYATGSWAIDEDFRTMTFVSMGPMDGEDTDFMTVGTLSFPSFDVFRVGEDGYAQWLSRNEGEPPTNEPTAAKLAGISGDGNTVFIETPESLVAGGPGTKGSTCLENAPGLPKCNLYRWTEGKLEAVGYDEHGNPLDSAVLGTGLTTGPLVAAGSIGSLPDSAAVSRDGASYVYVGAPSGAAPQVYLHMPDGETVRVSSSQRDGNLGEPAASGASFVAATGDLGAVYFRSEDQLTDEAPISGGDYRYDVITETLSFSNPHSLAQASDDGSYVYFLRSSNDPPLAPGAPENTASYYVKDHSQIRYVGSIAGQQDELQAAVTGNSISPVPGFTNTGLSRDGSRFLFQTRYPNVAGAPSDSFQVYLYDSQSDIVRCLSCPTPGFAPGSSRFDTEADADPPTPRALSSDGLRAVFTSDAALVSQDTNGVGDVYEYHDGRTHLVSSGRSPFRSFFAGMSESGDDIFFMTREGLAASDTDGGQYDVYDAHVEGGFAGPPASTVPPCSGDSCQRAGQSVTTANPPGSATQSSHGNVKTKRSAKKIPNKRRHGQRRGKHKKRTGTKHPTHSNRRVDR